MVKRTKAQRSAAARKAAVRRKKPTKKKPFGGYTISFADRKETLEQVFGDKVTPIEMTKKLWNYIKVTGLGSKT